ncbi:uncharacterized protein DUF2461 [Kribbella steppae]|uniref:Uncharacterized protein DUF2461 n=1 Tax=Kribbella steppae TaxID=2512223 RepID=A0A4R2GZX5_9ACTN|nr:DUF2461 family protein [Kribbella steppae]TCO17551.1 uncharacterized protein DUF2461 [Kribbella steppae]
MGFQGWTDAAFDVLVDLEGDPSPAQLETHRDDLERSVRGPLQELCDALNEKDEFGTFWLSGLSERPAAWQSQRATWWIARRIRITFTFDLDGLTLGGGSASPAGDQVELFRAMVDAEASGAELAGLVERLRRNGFELTGPSRLRVPGQYSPDHPRADLLRLRSVYAEKPIDTDDIGLITKALRPLVELATWYTDYVVTTGWEKP